MKYFSSKFSNVKVVDISKYDRSWFTRQGLQLNRRGKSKLASDINNLASKNVAFKSYDALLACPLETDNNVTAEIGKDEPDVDQGNLNMRSG